jgi:phospholipid/cholesterol/gamma-HCH transport system ATP-binding protein
MIEFKNLKKRFDDKVVLDDVSHVMETGKTNLIIGQSGSGKTVLQKCLVGLFEPDEGEIIYDGVSFTDMTVEERKELRQKIGMLFQGSALFDSMNVEQNIMFPLDMFAKGSSVEKLNPKFLFCDEPNSGLDPQTSLVIDKLIHDITVEFNMTTIINTHDMNSVMEIGENIIYLFEGQKEWNGNKDDIIFSKSERLNNFIFASEFLQDAKDMRMLEAKGKISDDRDMDKMLKGDKLD